ncbi:MAG: phosphoheptose isomerase [Flavobacteriales bacterium]|nr:phosphoheptose isomerase [Flavobacteriales bacterium]
MNEFSGRPNAAKVQLNELVDQKGKPASPTLPAEIKNYLIDIDGTITEDVPNEDPERMATCLPFPDALQTLNRWHADGHIITFFTSRTEEHRAVTEAWFDKHGFLYHGLLMGKPRGGNYHWVDNHIVRATRYEGTFSDLVREQAEIEVFKKG